MDEEEAVAYFIQDSGSVSTYQCSLCPNKYRARLSITEHVRNVYKKKLAHNMVTKWALLAADNLEHGKVLANTTSI